MNGAATVQRPRSGVEIASLYMAANPTMRFAVSFDDAAVGYWDEKLKRFRMCCGRTITNGQPWIDLPYELLINGEPPVKAEEWIEVPKSAE